jgi:hypothetical protein
VLNDGGVQQVGTPMELYDRPPTASSPASSAPPTAPHELDAEITLSLPARAALFLAR